MRSNFGNMVSMALASLFIPFLPLTPIQVLLNNLLYDLSETGIPFDSVDAPGLAPACLAHGRSVAIHADHRTAFVFIRSRDLWSSRPHPAPIATSLGALAVAVALALSPAGRLLGFAALPWPAIAAIIGLVLFCLADAEHLKRFPLGRGRVASSPAAARPSWTSHALDRGHCCRSADAMQSMGISQMRLVVGELLFTR